MSILTKEQLVAFALAKLGSPITTINVTPEQINYCFEEAIEKWWHFHPDGLEKMYMKHIITGSLITVANPTGFEVNQYITVPGNGYTVQIHAINGSVLELHKQPFGNLLRVGDTIISSTGNTTTVTAVTLGDIDNQWLPISDLVYGVTRVFPFISGISTSRNLFDLQYQLRLNNMYDLSSTTLAYYAEVMTHVQMLDTMLNGKPMFRFNRLQNQLKLDIHWGNDVRVGDYIVVEGYRVLDPAEYARVYGEPWLRKYFIALIKQQWGTNLKKWQGVQLIGGVTVDGQSLFDEGTQEMKDLEDEIINGGAPLEFFVG